jgi:hypothetical protein
MKVFTADAADEEAQVYAQMRAKIDPEEIKRRKKASKQRGISTAELLRKLSPIETPGCDMSSHIPDS